METIHTKKCDFTLWKNGGGQTQVLAQNSPNWRVSLATISQDGPYSAFPNTMRHQTIVEGRGLSLDFAEGHVDLLLGTGQEFNGEAPVKARLFGGPVKALNVMWQPGLCNVHVSEFTSADTITWTQAKTFVWFAFQGTFFIDGQEIAQGDAALCKSTHLPALNVGARVLLISLTEIS